MIPRIRSVKPELAKHELMFELERETGMPLRFAWAILPAYCDRTGRFLWRPRPLKTEILPYDDVDFARVLDTWLTRGFLVKYRVGSDWYGWLPTFLKHQVPNNRERQSELPSLQQASEILYLGDNPDVTRQLREYNAWATPLEHAPVEGKGREGKGRGDAPPERVTAKGTPYGLADLQYATKITENAGLPSTPALLRLVAGCVSLIAKREGMESAEASDWLDERRAAAQDEGVQVTKFWFEDGKYNAQSKPKKAQPVWAHEEAARQLRED